MLAFSPQQDEIQHGTMRRYMHVLPVLFHLMVKPRIIDMLHDAWPLPCIFIDKDHWHAAWCTTFAMHLHRCHNAPSNLTNAIITSCLLQEQRKEKTREWKVSSPPGRPEDWRKRGIGDYGHRMKAGGRGVGEPDLSPIRRPRQGRKLYSVCMVYTCCCLCLLVWMHVCVQVHMFWFMFLQPAIQPGTRSHSVGL